MLKEIRKRPFIRPLFFWILGSIGQFCFPLQRLSYLFLLPVAGVLLYSLLSGRDAEKKRLYENRWVWGVLFCLVVLFLSIQAVAFQEQRLLLPGSPLGQLRLLAIDWQERAAGKLAGLRLTETEWSVLSTLTVGYRQVIEPAVNQQFIVTGVVHILSVSGFHVAVVCAAVKTALSFLPKRNFFRYFTCVVTIVIVWIYTGISGLEVPAVRSATMLSLFLTGNLLRKQTDGYNTLAATAFLMLVYQPFYLLDIGFQLSYLAVFSLLYLQPRLQNLLKVRNPLLSKPWSWITVTVAAQVGTFFLCCYYFGQFSTVFLFTNLPLTLLSSLLIPLTLVWMLLPGGMEWALPLQRVIEWLTEALMGVVDAFSRIPFAVQAFRFDFVSMVLGYAALILLFYYGRSRRLKVLFSALGLVLADLIYRIVTGFQAAG